MPQSPEYPDLPWAPPRSWTRALRSEVQVIVIHTTEGSARPSSAEDGAAYDQRREDGTSTHYFHDSDSTVQCVETRYRAHTARAEGNWRGIHHELCTRAGSAVWGDSYHQAMLRRAARQCARDVRRWKIPVRKLSPAQVAAGLKGFCGHVEISKAFGQSDHTDPGKNFPWNDFLVMVAQELNPPKEIDVDSKDIEAIADRVVAKLTVQVPYKNGGGSGSPVGRGVIDSGYPRRPGDQRAPAWLNLQGLQLTLDEILKKVTADDDEYAEVLSSIDQRLASLQELLDDEDAQT